MRGRGLEEEVCFPAPLGVLSCEVPGSDCPSQHHREVFHQELGAQRCLHSGELQGCRWGWRTSSLLLPQLLLHEPLAPQIPVMVYLDPVAVVAEGVPWWVILLAVLAGLLVLALLVLLLWKVRLGRVGPVGAGLPWRGGSLSLVVLIYSALSTYPACARDSVRSWSVQRQVRCRSCPQGFDSLVREGSLVVKDGQ